MGKLKRTVPSDYLAIEPFESLVNKILHHPSLTLVRPDYSTHFLVAQNTHVTNRVNSFDQKSTFTLKHTFKNWSRNALRKIIRQIVFHSLNNIIYFIA